MSWKILAVDDHRGMRNLIRFGFEEKGCQVLEASNGKVAIDQVASWQPHLVLMDVMMPTMDGFTACKILRNNDETAHIPIIHMSSVISPEHHQKSEDAGAELILTKPTSIFDLVDTVHTFLEAYYPPENATA